MVDGRLPRSLPFDLMAALQHLHRSTSTHPENTVKFPQDERTAGQQLRAAIDLLHVLASALHSASLNCTPMLGHVQAWMRSPKVGDMVVEVTTAFMRADKGDQERARHDSFGTLLAIEAEPVHSDSDWERVKDDFDGVRPTEKVYYVATMDGAVARWTNARFVRVPRSYGEWTEAEGNPLAGVPRLPRLT